MGIMLGGLAAEVAGVLDRFAVLAEEIGESPLAAVALRQVRQLKQARYTVGVVADAGLRPGPFLNALVDGEVFPERLPPEAVPVRVTEGDEPGFALRLDDGRQVEVAGPRGLLPEAVARHAAGLLPADVAEAVVRVPNPFGRQGIDLLVFPAYESFLIYARKAQAQERCDIDAVVIWLGPAGSDDIPGPELFRAATRLVYNRLFFIPEQIAAPHPSRRGEDRKGLRAILSEFVTDPLIYPVSLQFNRETGGMARLEGGISEALRQSDRAARMMLGPLLWAQQRFQTVIIPGLEREVAALQDGRDLEALYAKLESLSKEFAALQARRQGPEGGPIDHVAERTRACIAEAWRPAALIRFFERDVFSMIEGAPLRMLTGEAACLPAEMAFQRFHEFVLATLREVEQQWFSLAAELDGGEDQALREAVAAAGVRLREGLGPPPGETLRGLGSLVAALAASAAGPAGERAYGLLIGGLAGLAAGEVFHQLTGLVWAFPAAVPAGLAAGLIMPAWFRDSLVKARIRAAFEQELLALIGPGRAYSDRFNTLMEQAVREALATRNVERLRELADKMTEFSKIAELRREEKAEGVPRCAAYLDEARELLEHTSRLLALLREEGLVAPDELPQPVAPAADTGEPGWSAGQR